MAGIATALHNPSISWNHARRFLILVTGRRESSGWTARVRCSWPDSARVVPGRRELSSAAPFGRRRFNNRKLPPVIRMIVATVSGSQGCLGRFIPQGPRLPAGLGDAARRRAVSNANFRSSSESPASSSILKRVRQIAVKIPRQIIQKVTADQTLKLG